MPTFEKRSSISAPRDALFAYHARPGALDRLVPPWQQVRILERSSGIADGARVVLRAKLGPLWRRWVAEHFDYVEGTQFRDRQVEGPFRSWVHTHRFESGAEGSILHDRIDYELPRGTGAASGYVAGELHRMFTFRHARTGNDLARQLAHAHTPRLRVAISGASGAVASNLIPFLTTAGHSVARLVRGEAREGDIRWNAITGELDERQLARCDAVVHLAGRSIATRWTPAVQRELWQSRVDATRALCQTLAAMPAPRPRVLIAASAVGYYGDRGDEPLTETSGPGEQWTSTMCAAWEAATQPARDAGIRVVTLRIGVVLSANSGALRQMLTPAKLGVAGRIGSGRQWMPWIAMDDLVYTVHEALCDDDWSGVINAVTDSVRQGDFMHTLGRVLRRPTLLPMPSAAVVTLFGQMGRELLLASANVLRTSRVVFSPTLPTLDAALRFELGAAQNL